MSDYSALKATIDANITDNGHGDITGPVLNAVLNEMVDVLGEGSGGSNLTGYVSVASVADLPEVGEPTLGYLVGTDLYLYVGEGGDTAGGTYQNCGPFRGPAGANGRNGQDGADGINGEAGKSAYQIWLDEGHTGTEADFLASLQGNSGYTGASGELEIVNNLVDGGATKALSAEMGKTLHGLVTYETELSGVWRQGTLATNNTYLANNNARIIIAIPYTGMMTLHIASGYYASVHSYSAEFADAANITSGTSYLGNISGGWLEGVVNMSQPTGGKTYVIVVKKGSAGTATIGPSEGPTAIPHIYGEGTSIKPTIKQMFDSLYGYGISGDVPLSSTWRQGSLTDNYHNYNPSMTTRIIAAFATSGGIKFSVTSGYYASVHAYSQEYTDINQITSTTPGYLGQITNGWREGDVELANPGSALTYVIVVKKGSAGTTNIAPSEGTTAVTDVKGDIVRVEGLVEEMENLLADSGSYVWGADLIKRQVKTQEIGSLVYLQAFCKYDGKYYSTNGSKIAEQDETFATLRDVSINLGHGNSLQLVSGGKVWSSGWDDNKMYKVDLATLAVESTITLPTTGYTTAAVDEANGRMYIFQRSSYPTSQAAYNFITYDYINQEILSTRVIETFAALQSVDYYEGKILMLYGYGTTAIPSGMRVYNTAGDVIATYDLAIFNGNEPEGIMFTRDTHELLVSDEHLSVFKVVEK